MKMKIEYSGEDIAKLIGLDLRKRFPGQIAPEGIDHDPIPTVEVSVSLSETPIVEVSHITETPRVVKTPSELPEPKRAHQRSADDLIPLPPPPRPHSERPFDPTATQPPSGIEAWGIKPRG